MVCLATEELAEGCKERLPILCFFTRHQSPTELRTIRVELMFPRIHSWEFCSQQTTIRQPRQQHACENQKERSGFRCSAQTELQQAMRSIWPLCNDATQIAEVI
jgi:hypothetical protein